MVLSGLFQPENPTMPPGFHRNRRGWTPGAQITAGAAERFAALTVITAIPARAEGGTSSIAARVKWFPSPSAPLGYFAGKTSK
jgi:hypothetical protein